MIQLVTEIPGPRSRALRLERRRYVSAGVFDPRHGVFFDRANGATMTDVDGNVFLDLSGGIGCLNAGHSAPRVLDRARAQLEKLQHAAFMVAGYEPYIALCRKLCEIAPIEGPAKAALFNSGAEAVENAVKIARRVTGRAAVLAFDPGFHGRTLLTMTLTSKHVPYKEGFGPFAPEVYRCPIDIDSFHRFLKSTITPTSLACAIIEPVLTPVTTSTLGRGSGPVFSPQPSRKPIEKAPQAPPAETERIRVGGAAGPRAAAWAAILSRSARARGVAGGGATAAVTGGGTCCRLWVMSGQG
jgi:hypothetical protein